MSTTETIPKNPIEEGEGLSPEDNREAEDLGHNRKIMYQIRDEDRKAGNMGYYPFGFIPAAIERGTNNLDAKHSDRIATKHYKAHEGAYQIQAVKDAAVKGVHTNFGVEKHNEEAKREYHIQRGRELRESGEFDDR